MTDSLDHTALLVMDYQAGLVARLPGAEELVARVNAAITSLRSRGVTTLVLAGISTCGVVLSTVREAMDRDYRIVVLRDACADPEPAHHTFLVESLFPRYASVIDTAELSAVSGTGPAAAPTSSSAGDAG